MGCVNMPGDLIVNNNIEALNLAITEGLNVSGETVLQNTVIQGDITVTGKINCYDKEEEKPKTKSNVVEEGTLYLGDPETEGVWRVRMFSGQLLFEKKIGDDWMVKQSLM